MAQQNWSEEYENLFWLAARDIVFFATYDEEEENWTDGWSVAVNCNDTFYYACADAEQIAPGEVDKLKEVFDKFSWSGVTAWCAVKRGTEPLKQLQTEQYQAAKQYISVPESPTDTPKLDTNGQCDWDPEPEITSKTAGDSTNSQNPHNNHVSPTDGDNTGKSTFTRDEFLAITGGRKHDRESHHSWGAVCYWDIDGKVYEEHQPDIGKVVWLVQK